MTIPAGAHIIDVTGKTLMPGMIDIHWHGQPIEGVHAIQSWTYMAALAYGVTTFRDWTHDGGFGGFILRTIDNLDGLTHMVAGYRRKRPILKANKAVRVPLRAAEQFVFLPRKAHLPQTFHRNVAVSIDR